jgi:protein involved in polysaccharide export with SLBB domain
LAKEIGWDGLALILVILLALPQMSFAQEATKQIQGFKPLEPLSTAQEQPLESPPHPALREMEPLEGQALEGAVDPQIYRLGPGDLIGFSALGDVAQDFFARVAADGSLRIQTLGVFQAGGRTFAQVKEEILEAATRSYRTDQLAVYLAQLREFKASIGGMVWNPGTYRMTATDRVTSLIALAGGFFSPPEANELLLQPVEGDNLKKEREAEEFPDLPAYSTRHARIIHRDGTIEPVDLLLFLRAGRPEGNPYLQDGDFLLIPPLNSPSGLLGIYGSVHQPGQIEYVAGDNLERALLLAGGMTEEADRRRIEIVRPSASESGFAILPVDGEANGALAMLLQPDDRIYVRPKFAYHPPRQIELRGEVVRPGFYAVAQSGTPIMEVIERAGGFTEQASLTEAILTRRWQQEPADPEFERLRLMAPDRMSKIEYQYYKSRVQEYQGLVSVNLRALYVLGDSSQNIRLWDQDLLEIPALTKTIRVTGQVNKPGLLNHEPGENYSYYLKESGGYAWNASPSKARIIKAVSGKWVKPGKTDIEAGDTIFIPAKPDPDTWLVIKDIMLIASQLATLYLVAVSATK